MYYNLAGALKARLVLELKDSFSRHPVYQKIVPTIQNRQSFEERPQFGIIVQGSSTNKVQLDPSNFIGTVQSYVMLAQVDGRQDFPLEWVKEDLDSIRLNGGRPLTLPGVYYLEILQAPTNPNEDGFFIIDPLLTVTNEPVLRFTTGFETEGQLQHEPLDRTLRLYVNGVLPLKEGEDYTLEPLGVIKFLRTFGVSVIITADYRYPGESTQPTPFRWNQANTTILPGIVLAFGKRAAPGQKVAVVVYSDRVDTAEAYGGKNEISYDLEVLARDTAQCSEIADLVWMYLWSEKRAALGFEGIEILDVSQGGESEDPIDETGQDFQYTVSLSVQLRADWEVHVPLPLTISRVEITEVSAITTRLYLDTAPLVVGRNVDFERIS